MINSSSVFCARFVELPVEAIAHFGQAHADVGAQIFVGLVARHFVRVVAVLGDALAQKS